MNENINKEASIEFERILKHPEYLDSFVGYLLYYLCKNESKPISPDYKVTTDSKAVYADYVLDKGCEALGMEKQTLVEVKQRLTNNSFQHFRILADYSKMSVLVVTLENIHVKLFELGLKGRNIKIISLTDLLDIAVSKGCDLSSYSGFSLQSYNEGENIKEDFSNTISEQPAQDTDVTECITYNNKTIEKAQEDYKNKRITLFLGAGIGASAGLPSWDILLKNILSDTLQVPLNQYDYPAINVASFNSPIISARYMFSPLLDNNKELSLVNQLTAALYPEKNKTYTSELINTIVHMCTNGDNKTPKEGLSIITFNFDDLIESHMKQNGVPYQQIYQEGIIELNKIPIIHVHGILRQSDPNTSLPILSEKDYHQLYKSSFHWSNIEIEHALYRTTCIFIGLSMSDPNLRRLLEFVASESNGNTPHYAILPKRTLENCNWDAANATKYYKCSESKEDHFIQRQISVYKQLGINVIWYEDQKFEQIPIILRKIAGF